MKLFKSYITSLTIIILIGLTFVNFVQAFQGETLEGYFQGNLPSVQERIPLAIECGIAQYVGSKEQNNTLLECIKKGDKEIEKILIPQIINEEGDAILGAGYTPVTGYQSRTTQYISSAATTIPVVSTLDKAGNQIDLSSISPSSTVKVYMNLAPGTSKEEPIMCTGLTAASWTGCTRGLSFQGSSESSSSTLAQNHNAGTPIIITNIGQSFNQFVSVEGAQNIYGVKTFYLYPEVPSTLGFPTTTYQLVTKQYVDTVGLQGAPTSTESTGGISELATQIEMASTTDLGATRPLVLQAKYATSTCQVAGLYIPVTQNNGKLSNVCLDLTQNYTWTGLHIISGGLVISGGLNVSSTNATTNIFFDSFKTTSSTVTSTFLGGLALSTIGSTTTGQTTTTILNNLQVKGNIQYTGSNLTGFQGIYEGTASTTESKYALCQATGDGVTRDATGQLSVWKNGGIAQTVSVAVEHAGSSVGVCSFSFDWSSGYPVITTNNGSCTSIGTPTCYYYK